MWKLPEAFARNQEHQALKQQKSAQHANESSTNRKTQPNPKLNPIDIAKSDLFRGIDEANADISAVTLRGRLHGSQGRRIRALKSAPAVMEVRERKVHK